MTLKPLMLAVVAMSVWTNGNAQTKINNDTLWYKQPINKIYKLSGYSNFSGSLTWAANSIWFKVTPMPSSQKTDSLIIYVDKKRLRWINDSTAVVIKQ